MEINMAENKPYSDIWNMTLVVLKEKENYSDTLINLWFGDLKLALLTETNAVLVNNSPFKRDIIKSKYIAALERAFEEVLGFRISVEVRAETPLDVPSGKTDGSIASALSGSSDSADDNTSAKSGDDELDFYTTVGSTKAVNYASVYKTFKFNYTFDTFVVGNSNHIAHAACVAVASHPAQAYNPLFIYGQSGLGKTHLLYAITDSIMKNYPDMKVVYVKGEEFTNQLVDAISRNITQQFRERYRFADVLLIDDIQFIAGKEATQEEFFHTFNELHESNKQIIMTSDRPPKDIKNLEDRLRTRFEWGLIADIQPPDLELRTAILKNKAAALKIELPAPVLTYIAENLKSNVRQLEGAVKKISAYSLLSGLDITVDLAIKCISDMLIGSEPVSVTKDKILEAVSKKYNIPIESIQGKKRTNNIVTARHISIYLVRTMTDMSLPAIGRVFNRDHTTIMNSLDTIEAKLRQSPALEAEINELIKEIRN